MLFQHVFNQIDFQADRRNVGCLNLRVQKRNIGHRTLSVFDKLISIGWYLGFKTMQLKSPTIHVNVIHKKILAEKKVWPYCVEIGVKSQCC